MAERRGRPDRRRAPYGQRPAGGSLARRFDDLVLRVDDLEEQLVEERAILLSLLASTINGEANYRWLFHKVKISKFII